MSIFWNSSKRGGEALAAIVHAPKRAAPRGRPRRRSLKRSPFMVDGAVDEAGHHAGRRPHRRTASWRVDARLGGDPRAHGLGLAVDIVAGALAGNAQHEPLAVGRDLVVPVGEPGEALDREFARGARLNRGLGAAGMRGRRSKMSRCIAQRFQPFVLRDRRAAPSWRRAGWLRRRPRSRNRRSPMSSIGEIAVERSACRPYGRNWRWSVTPTGLAVLAGCIRRRPRRDRAARHFEREAAEPPLDAVGFAS